MIDLSSATGCEWLTFHLRSVSASLSLSRLTLPLYFSLSLPLCFHHPFIRKATLIPGQLKGRLKKGIFWPPELPLSKKRLETVQPCHDVCLTVLLLRRHIHVHGVTDFLSFVLQFSGEFAMGGEAKTVGKCPFCRLLALKLRTCGWLLLCFVVLHFHFNLSHLFCSNHLTLPCFQLCFCGSDGWGVGY